MILWRLGMTICAKLKFKKNKKKYNRIVPMEILPCETRLAFPGESQLRQSRATQPLCMLGVLVFP